jgi:aminoglycoside phosphotransferase family enzyme/predicted kinase
MDMPDPLLAALMRPATYPHPAAALEHIETHISHVFLAGDYAYKLKKPVDFGFLDFTTPEKRRMACEAEVRLNARLAPDYYLGVVPLCDGAHGYHLRPQGCSPDEHPAEPLVQMRRLPQDGMLDHLAGTARLDIETMVDIARQMARFHASAARGPDIDRYGSIDSIRAPVAQNYEQTRPYIGRVVSPTTHARLQAWSESFLASHTTLFAERVQAGMIVDGHGDLHLRNMCRVDHRVVIFDCIEFNPALRAGDVMNDIAFLTMDLDHRALTAHGNKFINEYLQHTQDYAGLKLLDFYQVYRACVRAKVTAFETDKASPALRHAHEQEAASYFDLAEEYLLPKRTGILLTCGVSGSGKTTLARRAATFLNGVMVRSDAVRKHLAGIGLSERGGELPGEGIYTPAMTERTYVTLGIHAREILASHRWVILDAVYGRRNEREAVAGIARQLGVPFGILYCQAPRDELVRRLDRRKVEGRDISDATIAVLDSQLARFEAPSAEEGLLFTWSGCEDPSAWLATLRSRR